MTHVLIVTCGIVIVTPHFLNHVIGLPHLTLAILF